MFLNYISFKLNFEEGKKVCKLSGDGFYTEFANSRQLHSQTLKGQGNPGLIEFMPYLQGTLADVCSLSSHENKWLRLALHEQ